MPLLEVDLWLASEVRSKNLSRMQTLKTLSCAMLALALAACSTTSPAPQTSSNPSHLPFGDMRVVSPAQIDQVPLLEVMPSPFELSAELARRKITGEATIGFTVSSRGKLEHIRVLHATDPKLGELAARYVGSLIFHPGRLGGAAIACEMEIPFSQK